MRKSFISTAVLVALAAPTLVYAEDAAPADAAPAAPADAAPAAPAAPALMQGMNFPLANNPNPLSVDAGPLGKVYISGALSGLAFSQTHRGSALPQGTPAGADAFGKQQKSDYGDISNAQVILQKVDGLVQFYVQGGSYSMPTLGNNYYRSSTYTDKTFGNIPVAFVKLAPTDNFSIQAGKLPTLIGTEYAFTFQNTNIERGLLWNQENIISRGVQANLTLGPVALSGALTDGFYTKDYSYLTGLATYTINDNNAITIAAGGNTGGSKAQDIDTKNPLVSSAVANSQQYNLYYKNVTGPWTFQPIIQYTKVNQDTVDSISKGGHTTGGSLIVNYAFNENYSLAARAEYIKESGDATTTVNTGAGALTTTGLLGYGVHAPKAYSITLTPTYQQKSFFARADLSYVKINGGDATYMFGSKGNDDSQARAMGEVGFLF